MFISTYIYIYIYTGDYAVRRWTIHHACQEKCKNKFLQILRNFAQPFSFIPAHSYRSHSSQVKLFGTNASFGAIEFFPLLQSFLYNCKAVSTGIIDVHMCKERHHPIPTPTHPIVVTGEGKRSRVNIYIYIYI